jgi:hypothetical protein
MNDAAGARMVEARIECDIPYCGQRASTTYGTWGASTMAQKFTSVELATEYVVTTLNDVVDRWPEERLDVLSGTLQWSVTCLEQGLPLNMPPPAHLHNYMSKGERRRVGVWPDSH